MIRILEFNYKSGDVSAEVEERLKKALEQFLVTVK